MYIVIGIYFVSEAGMDPVEGGEGSEVGGGGGRKLGRKRETNETFLISGGVGMVKFVGFVPWI